MEWHDTGLIIGTKSYGETSLVLETMTRAHGRHLGLVKGGRSKRMQPLLQPGNSVELSWRARLEEHLGLYAVEATVLRAGDLMAGPATLFGLNLVTSLLRVLPEREPHEAMYDFALALVERLDDPEIAPAHLVRFELAILAECGFGVDLGRCAATGTRDDLAFVSPKSSRAVSRAAGELYRDRLLRLPGFLVGARPNRIATADILDGFALGAFFLLRNVFAPRGLALPDAHQAYVTLLSKRELL